MALITWDDSYSVQVKDIDEQHLQLIYLINKMHDAMSTGQGKLILAEILEELVDYTKTHFSYEEQIMLKCQYPDFNAHKDAHEALTKKVMDFQKRYQAGQVALSVEMMNFLKDWLTNHIVETDKRYIPYLTK